LVYFYFCLMMFRLTTFGLKWDPTLLGLF
jgi:hypothetical protein